MSNWFRRVWHLLNRRRHERELVREMSEHRESMHDPSTFGDTHRLLERSRDAWGWNWLDDAMQDLSAGMRALKRSPVFTLTAILILSFGIGLNLTVFQMAHVVLLRGPSIDRPDTIARFHRHGRAARSNSEAVPYVAAMAVARENSALSAVLVESWAPISWGEASSVVEGSFVSSNWFTQLGYGAALGRAFMPELEDKVDAPPVMVASHRFWKNALGGDPSIVGTTIRVNGRPVTLIGVMPDKFPELDLDESAAWLLMTQRDYYFPNDKFLTDWSTNNVAMYGRLKDGVTPAMARDNLRSTVAMLHREHPGEFDDGDWLEPALATSNFTEPAERLGFLGVASTIGLLSTLVLIVAATNLSNLVISRATSRARELGVRIALGARRSRIVRQLVVETVPLGLIGAAGGLLFAVWSTQTIAALGGLPSYLDFTPDLASIGASLVFTMLALAVVGVLPAWKISKQDLTDAIRDGGQQVSLRLDRARVRSLMLAAQVGASCVVLIVSAMMVRSLQLATTAELGFSYQDGAVLQAALARAGIKGEAARSYWRSVEERVAANPAIKSAVLSLAAPFNGRSISNGYPESPRLRVATNHVGAEYFSALDIPVMAGRTFRADDDPNTTVVVSRTLAAKMYGGLDVLGKGFPRSNPHDTIVGVVGDTSSVRPGATDIVDLYRPLSNDDYEKLVLVARARMDTTALLLALREAAKVDPRISATPRLMRDDFERRVSGTKIASSIGVSIGLLTLLLACIGIFGVVSYGVTLRAKEVGIHLALGASHRAVLRSVTRRVLSPVFGGLAAGTIAAAPIAFALSRSPLQLAFADPLSYAAAMVILAVSGFLAAAAPAVRALNTNPIHALRHE